MDQKVLQQKQQQLLVLQTLLRLLAGRRGPAQQMTPRVHQPLPAHRLLPIKPLLALNGSQTNHHGPISSAAALLHQLLQEALGCCCCSLQADQRGPLLRALLLLLEGLLTCCPVQRCRRGPSAVLLLSLLLVLALGHCWRLREWLCAQAAGALLGQLLHLLSAHRDDPDNC
jgi:hypothetical protein